MSPLIGIPLVVVAGAVYVFVGAVAAGRTMDRDERYAGVDLFTWVTAWPLWLAVLGVAALAHRGVALGQRLNPRVRVELRAEAARELARSIESLERSELGRTEPPPSGSLTPPRSLTGYRAAGVVPPPPPRRSAGGPVLQASGYELRVRDARRQRARARGWE